MGSRRGLTALAAAVVFVVGAGAGSAGADGAPSFTISVSAPSTVSQGDPFAATVVLQNTGTGPATGGDLSVTFPASNVATPLAYSTPYGSCTELGNVVHCAGFTLDPGASATLTIQLKAVGAPGTHLGTTASASSSEGASAQTSSDTVVTGTPTVAYSMGESISPNTVSPGGSATVTVSATNSGVDGTSMYVVLFLGPGSWSLGGASQSSGPPFSCTTDQYDMTCFIGTWNAGTSASFSVPVTLGTSAPPGTLLNSRDAVFQGAPNGGSLASASASLLVGPAGAGGGSGGGSGGGGGSTGASTTTLTVARSGSDLGSVTSAPGGIDCGGTCTYSFATGTTVTLTETPVSGAAFTGWDGACKSAKTAPTCTVTMSAAQQVVAAFASAPSKASAPASAPLRRPTQRTHCTPGRLPDRDCTPGAVFITIAPIDLCDAGYAAGVAPVSAATRSQVFAAYGIPRSRAAGYALDHLVPIGLGGSDDRTNLWPEPIGKPPAAHQKDRLENLLHQRVCDGALQLERAQFAVAENWLAEYHRTGLG